MLRNKDEILTNLLKGEKFVLAILDADGNATCFFGRQDIKDTIWLIKSLEIVAEESDILD